MMVILVVEGNPAIAVHLQDILGRLFPSALVRTARSIAEAESALTSSRPDVVFLDLTLPLGDGRASIRLDGTMHVTADARPLLAAMLERRPDLPVVVISGLPQEAAEVVDCFCMGARGHLRKPLGQDAVRSALHALEGFETARLGRDGEAPMRYGEIPPPGGLAGLE